MPLNQAECSAFNSFLIQHVPNWETELSRDRFPTNTLYNGMYPAGDWPSGVGTELTWERIHVASPNDNGCWDEVNTTACVGKPCDPSRNVIGWGMSSEVYGKHRRIYETIPLCFDQLRDTTHGIERIQQIYEGLKRVPDKIMSDYMRQWTLRSGGTIYIAGSADTRITITDDTFTNTCNRIDLGSADNLPTSKLTMQYLNNHYPELLGNGYFDRDYNIDGLVTITSDMQTWQDLSNANPQLYPMYTGADFMKGGKYYAYGVMARVGQFLFKLDSEQLRYRHIGGGVLERIYPYENEDATIGLKPKYSTAYNNAPYARYHVYNTQSRKVKYPNAKSGSDLKFGDRMYNGQWQWSNPDVLIYTDPNTGVECTLNNDFHNKGKFIAWYEIGVKTEYPLIEMNIIAQRQNAVVTDNPYCGDIPSEANGNLLPYNLMCGDPELD